MLARRECPRFPPRRSKGKAGAPPVHPDPSPEEPMRSRLDRFVVALALPLFAFALVTTAGCGGNKGGTIKIGVYGSTTGTTATFGQSTENGVKLALEEINAAGGI